MMRKKDTTILAYSFLPNQLYTGVMDKLELSSNSSTTPAGSNIGGQYQMR
jgi:hypothetical protein